MAPSWKSSFPWFRASRGARCKRETMRASAPLGHDRQPKRQETFGSDGENKMQTWAIYTDGKLDCTVCDVYVRKFFTLWSMGIGGSGYKTSITSMISEAFATRPGGRRPLVVPAFPPAPLAPARGGRSTLTDSSPRALRLAVPEGSSQTASSFSFFTALLERLRVPPQLSPSSIPLSTHVPVFLTLSLRVSVLAGSLDNVERPRHRLPREAEAALVLLISVVGVAARSPSSGSCFILFVSGGALSNCGNSCSSSIFGVLVTLRATLPRRFPVGFIFRDCSLD